jgi:hypothetical protein
VSGTCQDCTWWVRREELSFESEWGVCVLADNCFRPPAAEWKFRACGSGDSGYLVTRCDFGCVQFKPKEPT